jgi:predicted exporter
MNALRLRAALWLVLALGVAVACVLQFAGSGGARLQTNLLALLPPTERNPVAEYAVGKLAEAADNRAVFLVGERSPEAAVAAARLLAAELRRAEGFRSVLAELPPMDLRQLSGFYLPHRFNLLSDVDRRALSSGPPDLEQRLQRKLLTPFRFGLSYPAAEDPFGLADGWLASLPLANLRLEPENGLLVTRGEGLTWAFVAAEPAGSSYDGDNQQRVARAVSAAEQALRAAHPEARLLRSGTVFYANAARASAEREVDFIGAGSLAGMLLLLYLVFRSIRPLALGLLTVVFGVAAAAAVTAAVHGELHLITLVFGASLIGEAIDYAVQYFAAHLGAGADWDAEAGLRRIAPGLTIALATSLLGYGALMLAPFPALSQIALFALVGLSAAWLSVFLLLPALLTRPGKRDPENAVALPRRFLLWWQTRVRPRDCFVVAGLLLVASVPGWLQLQSNDDVRLLVARPPGLVAQEEKIRELTGIGGSSQFFLVEGAGPDEVLANEERLAQRLAVLVASGELASFQATSAFVPSPQRQLENRRLWQEKVFSDEAALRALFARAELRDELADRQTAAFNASANARLTVEQWLAAPLSVPYRHLWLGAQANGHAAVVLPRGFSDLRRLRDAARDLPGVTLVDKPGSVSSLFSSYREWGAWWLAGALCLVYGLLCLRYGWRLGAVVLMPTLLAVALALGVFGYSGTPVTLFNIMGLMLVIGVGVNYAIFLREGGVRTAATLAGVLLSAGTTLLSFGLLAFSSMPALSSFGLTLLVGIGIAVLLAPMVLSFGTLPRA